MSRHDPDPDARIAALLLQVDASLDRSRDWIAARATRPVPVGTRQPADRSIPSPAMP